MLKINTNFKKYKIPIITMVIVVSGIFLFQYLTFIPEYSSAEEISTPVYDETKVDTRTLSDITYMQEMTSGICDRTADYVDTTNYVSKQLIDKRDSKTYWVAKLKDGNCWMTQNLELDLDSITLTRKDSDVNDDWTPSVTSAIWGNADSNVIKYYNPGGHFCPNGNCASTSESSSNDGHDAQGNFYSFNAAAAGSGPMAATDNSNVESSICPKGWKLPATTGDSSFVNLLNGITTGSELEGSPYYYIYGGSIYNGTLASPGLEGRYWSSTAAYNAANAYTLYYYSTVAYLSDAHARFYGCTVRCVNNPDTKDAPAIPEIDNPNISVTVDKILTMKLDGREVNVEPKTNEIMTGNFTATVSSNAGYDIGLSAAENSPISLVNKKDDIVIAEIPASNNIQVGTNGWGIKCIDDNDNCIIKNYNALTLYNNPQVYFSSTNTATNKPTHFEVGIGISPSLPSGTYSTNILITASQK